MSRRMDQTPQLIDEGRGGRAPLTELGDWREAPVSFHSSTPHPLASTTPSLAYPTLASTPPPLGRPLSLERGTDEYPPAPVPLAHTARVVRRGAGLAYSFGGPR